MNKSGRILASFIRCDFAYFSFIYSCICNYSLRFRFIIISSTILIDPNIIPPNIAFLKAILGPARKAKSPPVIAPAAIWLNASYLFLSAISVQSVIENNPAHNAKLPNLDLENTS